MLEYVGNSTADVDATGSVNAAQILTNANTREEMRLPPVPSVAWSAFSSASSLAALTLPSSSNVPTSMRGRLR